MKLSNKNQIAVLGNVSTSTMGGIDGVKPEKGLSGVTWWIG